MGQSDEIKKLLEENKRLKTDKVRITATAIMEYDRANPEVGMGKFWFMAVKEAMKDLGYTDDDVNGSDLSRR